VKSFLKVIVSTLALNFIALAGFTGWLWQTGRLDRMAVMAIKDLLFPHVSAVPAATTQPTAAAPTTRPISPLEELLARRSGSTSAAAQVDLIQQSVDAQMGQLDQRQRQLEDLQRLVAAAQAKMERDRASLEKDRKELTSEQQESVRLAADKGFQDSLNLYNSMAPKQVKSIFLNMDDSGMTNYLQAMEPRAAARIIKEFKTPDELERIHRVIDRMRHGQTDAQTQPGNAEPKNGQPQ
jgi:flagellar motility protein MotE (MotC chaperone)